MVPYSSSHLDGAQSEVIVPGPHGACELPQTIAELDRILRLHLGLSEPQEPPLLRRGVETADKSRLVYNVTGCRSRNCISVPGVITRVPAVYP